MPPVVQSLLVKKVKSTLPVGVPAPVPETVALSCTVDPSATEVTPPAAMSVAGLPLWITVTVEEFAWFTVSGSHSPVDVL